MIAKKSIKSNDIGKYFVLAVVLVVVLGSVGFLVLSNWKMYKKRADLNQRVEDYKKQIADLQKENDKMQLDLSQEGNSEYAEREIRERLDMKKPGENVVVVVPPKESGEAQQSVPQDFFQKLWANIKSLWE